MQIFVIYNYYDFEGPTCPLKAFSTYEKALDFIEQHEGQKLCNFTIGKDTIVAELELDDLTMDDAIMKSIKERLTDSRE